MKICPRCQKTYGDENLNFCLDDGTVLAQVSTSPLPETVLLNRPRITVPTQQVPGQQFPNQQMQQPAWNTGQQQQSMQPKKSSKTWIWVLLILGVLALVCGGGFVGFLAYVGSQANIANSTNVATNRGTTTSSTNSKSTNSTTATSTPTSSSTSSDRKDVEKVDLEEWVREFSAFGTTEYTNNELLMASKQKRFYYVLAGTKDQTTEDADTVVTLRNVDNADSSLGYGLVFHSNPQPLEQGYAFLIDTKKKKYHVVHHVPKDEISVVNWTKSDAIRDGAQENTLEIRDHPDKIDLYINGQMVTSIKNTYGYTGGVVGLYSGDAVKIAFKNLEIHK